MKTIHIGEWSARGSGRVGSDFLSAIAGRVGSGQRFGGSGRVGSKKSDPWTTLSYQDRQIGREGIPNRYYSRWKEIFAEISAGERNGKFKWMASCISVT